MSYSSFLFVCKHAIHRHDIWSLGKSRNLLSRTRAILHSVYSLNVNELKTPLFTFRAVPHSSLKIVVVISLFKRGFTPGQSGKSLKKMQISIYKSGRPLKKQICFHSFTLREYDQGLYYIIRYKISLVNSPPKKKK